MNERVLFEAALEIADPSARKAFVEKSCAGNSELRSRVAALLKSHETAGSFLDVPAIRQLPAELHPNTVVVPPSGNDDDESEQDHGQPDVSFLQPSGKPGSIGTLGHYEVLEILGHGSFGIVFKAFDEVLHRHVAIKVMNPQLAATSPPRKRFLREARAAAAIRHDNIVQVYSVEEQPLPYLVMEYIQGQTLQQKLAGSGPLDLAEVLHLARQIASGLAAAHAMGLIHRDIKPGNILIEQGVEQRVKITDFGLARAADDASLTRTGVISGTPMYMAPEQALGQALDHRSDLFSLGSVIYVMASGRPPFRASNMMAVLKRVTEDTPRPLREIIPEIPDWFVGIVNKLHAKQPDRRFNSAKEVSDLLARCLADVQANRSVELPMDDVPSTAIVSPLVADDNRRMRGSDGRLTASEGIAQRVNSRRAWPTIAAAALILLAGLGITEATGVTELTSTVIRLTTGSGTLVIETDDPNVKVTIDGEEVRIQGAGVEQLTLKPGQYKIAAVKDGKAVSQELVTITRGGKEVVRVTMEGIASIDKPVSRDPTGSALADPDRAAAEWVLSMGGRLTIRVSDKEGEIRSMNELPIQPFQLIHVILDHNEKVKDAGLSQLKGLKNLTHLRLDGTPLTDAGLSPLAGLENLARFNLQGTGVTDNGIEHLTGLTKMEHLCIHDNQLGDDGLKHLARMTELEHLELRNTQVGDAGLEYLKHLPTLMSIVLFNTKVTDRGLETLAAFPKLTGLGLDNTMVTDAGLDHLSKLLTLVDLSIYGTKVTEPGLKKLAAALPKCRIQWDGGVIEPRESSDGWHGWPADTPPPAIAPFDADEAKQHQEAWAKYLGVPVEYTNSIGMKFRLIPPGEFLMGSTAEEIEEGLTVENDDHLRDIVKAAAPRHTVALTQPFYLGQHEVTQKEYEAVVKNNPSHFSATGEGKDRVLGLNTDNHPVENVGWEAAVKYCDILSDREYLTPFVFRAPSLTVKFSGNGYRLPTEAEWEYTCRAGTAHKYWFGDRNEQLVAAAWFSTNSVARTHPVGQLKANPFGLHDVHGNVDEWVQDWYEPTYYSLFTEKTAVDPLGPEAAKGQRGCRGGNWQEISLHCPSSYRSTCHSGMRTLGFRVALSVEAVKQALKQKPLATATPVNLQNTTPPLSPLALVPRPAKLPGVKSWSLETVGPRSDIQSLDFSPDGERLATFGDDHTIRIWNLKKNQLERALIGPQTETRHLRSLDKNPSERLVQWSPQGDRLASTTLDGELHIWDADRGKLLNAFPLFQTWVGISWSPDGMHLALGGWEQTIIVETATGKLRGQWDQPWQQSGSTGHALAWSADGKQLAFGGRFSKGIHLVTLDGRQPARKIELPCESVGALLWAPQSKIIVFGQKTFVIAEETGEFETLKTPWNWDYPDLNHLVSLVWGSDGATILGTRTDGSYGFVSAVVPVSGAEAPAPSQMNLRKGVYRVIPSRDGKLIACVTDTDLRIFRNETDGLREAESLFQRNGYYGDQVSWSPDGSQLLSGIGQYSYGPLWLWNLKTYRPGWPEPSRLAPFFARWSPDAQLLAVYVGGRGSFIVQARNSEVINGFLQPTAPVTNSSFLNAVWSPNGQQLAVGTAEQLLIYDREARTIRQTFDNFNTGTWFPIAWSPDGKWVAVQGNRGGKNDTTVIDLARPEHPLTISFGGVNGDGLTWLGNTRLAIGGIDGRIEIWDVADFAKETVLRASDIGEAIPVRWLADEKLLATLGEDRTLRYFDQDGEEVRQVAVPVYGTLSPDLKRMASSGQKDLRTNFIRVWDIPSGQVGQTFVMLRDGGYAVVSPEGHFDAKVEKNEFVYVVEKDDGTQETLKPRAFAEKYGWKNDPGKTQASVGVKQAALPGPADPDRAAAEWALSVGIPVEIAIGNDKRTVQPGAELPQEPFELRYAALGGHAQATDEGLAHFVGCRNLVSLHLSGSAITDAGVANFKGCKKLVQFSLVETSAADAGLAYFEECADLESLVINATPVTDAGLAAFQNCRELRHLQLQQTKITDAGLANFQDCPLLQEIHLAFTSVSDAGLVHFRNCRDLTILNLSSTNVTDAGMENFRRCRELVQLTLDNTKVTDEGLANFRDCRRLDRLRLNGLGVTDAGLANFANCPDLKELTLHGAKFTDAGLAPFANCTKLIHLLLDNTPMTDAGLSHLANCTNLQRLYLDNTKITDAGLAHLKNCTGLTQVFLRNTQVGDAGLAHLKECQNLDYLMLDGTQVTDAGLAELSVHRRLTELQLNRTAVTDAGLEQLKALKTLKLLGLQKTDVTSAGVDALQQALPKCKIEW